MLADGNQQALSLRDTAHSQRKARLALTKVIQNLEKSYDKGEFILEESAKMDALLREKQYSIQKARPSKKKETEKENNKNPHIMETINMWVEKSSAALDVRSMRPQTLTSDNAIRSIDRAKIIKDAELAIKKDVLDQNSSNIHRFYNKRGEVYGLSYKDKIYLAPEKLNTSLALHEYTHLWDALLQKANPELWEHGKSMLKQLPFWEMVNRDPAYQEIWNDENKIASEVHARLVAQDISERAAMKNKDKPFLSSVSRELRKWVLDVFEWVRDNFTSWSKKEVEKVGLPQFVCMPLKDLLSGRKIETPKETAAHRRKGKKTPQKGYRLCS